MTSPVSPSPALPAAEWLAFHVPQPSAWVRVFCLPHAGGSASLFRTWQAELGQDIEVCPVQLPGRENRLREPPLRELPRVVDFLVDVVARHGDKPFALFGHSMGALLAYELTRALRERGLPTP
ncbi:thioesterase II family protein, partial [Myxococcus sp. CA039A]|uniref:thioesterase II family protein n=1 Tax=Myxococcus sp. CA039A TaxID=2741737 RepID=UPI00157A6478